MSLLTSSNPVDRTFDRASRYAPEMLSVLRIMTGLLLIEHGLQKLFGFPPSDRGTVDLFSLIGLSGIIEFFGGLLIILGLFTRPTAFILAGFTAFAYFMVHAERSFFPLINQGELAVLYCFVFLYLIAAGPGPWSLDARLGRRA